MPVFTNCRQNGFDFPFFGLQLKGHWWSVVEEGLSCDSLARYERKAMIKEIKIAAVMIGRAVQPSQGNKASQRNVCTEITFF